MVSLPTPENPRIAALFDVDGTLTIPRGEVKQDMMDCLKELRKKITIGIVGGSDLPKQEEQLGQGIVNEVVWNFSQNGLVAYEKGQLLESNSVSKHLGEDNIKRIVNWTMRYLADLDLPVKVRIFKTTAVVVVVVVDVISLYYKYISHTQSYDFFVLYFFFFPLGILAWHIH
jgi:HAD superfamily hydrolase (TIGR01484 family)